MWKYIGEGSSVRGVLPIDMTDEEFAEAEKRFDELEGVPGLLPTTGLWEHIPDGKSPKPAKEEE